MSTEHAPLQVQGEIAPAIRRAKFVLFVLAMFVGLFACVLMLVYGQPRHQVLVERWSNGYPSSETQCIAGPKGEPLPHGRYRAWHENGVLAEEGRYERGLRVGPWRAWDKQGAFELTRSGFYEAGSRQRELAPSDD